MGAGVALKARAWAHTSVLEDIREEVVIASTVRRALKRAAAAGRILHVANFFVERTGRTEGVNTGLELGQLITD